MPIRDFTMCRAALLAGLIALAFWAGDAPQPHLQATQTEPPNARIVPASAQEQHKICDTQMGVEL